MPNSSKRKSLINNHYYYYNSLLLQSAAWYHVNPKHDRGALRWAKQTILISRVLEDS